MSEIIDVSATTVQDDRSGWQAEDQIAVEYLEACKEAVASDTAFANFKSNPKYKTILEHVLKDQGQAYLNICKDMNEDAVWENIEAFKENDSIGNPETMQKKPSYKNVLLEIYDFFVKKILLLKQS